MTKKEFDRMIKDNIGSKVTFRTDKYDCYLDDKSFKDFESHMANNHGEAHKKYVKELVQKGVQPPKMASVASSSRFCYLALRDGAEALGGSGSVEFEKGLSITGIKGGKPQMDAYVKNENIFIEVKCHEIFDDHKINLSGQYYDLIYGKNNDFCLCHKTRDESEKGKPFNVPMSEFGSSDETMVDVKQLVCHLLGIASESKGEPATLVYLFFKPTTSDESKNEEINGLFCKLKKDIEKAFNSKPVEKFTEKHSITLKAVAQESKTMGKLTSEGLITLY